MRSSAKKPRWPTPCSARKAGAEKLLTEMSNDELLGFVALDLKSAICE